MKRNFVIYLILLSIIACNQKQEQEKDVDKTFQSFIVKFNNDSIFQKKRVKFPLSVIELENEDYTEVRRKIENEQYKIIKLTFDKADQKRLGYTQQIILDNNNAIIEIRGIENGIVGDYYFEKIDGKWMLISWSDLST